MPIELGDRRLKLLLKFVSACAQIREYDALLSLVAQNAHGLIDFERLTILLCDDNRQILRTSVIEGETAHDVSPDKIQLPEMDLMLQALISGTASRGDVGICTPMVSAGRMIGALCFAAKCDPYSKPDVKLAQFLADYLAGPLEHLAHDEAANGSTDSVIPVTGSDDPAMATSHALSLRMSYLAQHDALTDLPNRWLLNDRLTRALALSSRYRRRLAVLFLDLDHFKEINDSLGHAIGDQVLRRISDRLVKCVRISDTVSRIGGDEFVVLLAELESDRVASVCAAKIITAVTAPLKIAGRVLHVSVSIGIGIYPHDGEDAETLMKSADAAMYHAKAEGRGNCQVFTKDMDHAGREQSAEVSQRRSQHR